MAEQFDIGGDIALALGQAQLANIKLTAELRRLSERMRDLEAGLIPEVKGATRALDCE